MAFFGQGSPQTGVSNRAIPTSTMGVMGRPGGNRPTPSGGVRPGFRPRPPSLGSMGPRPTAPMGPSPDMVRQQFQPPVAQQGHLPLVNQPRPLPMVNEPQMGEVDLGSRDPREIARMQSMTSGLAPSAIPPVDVGQPGLIGRAPDLSNESIPEMMTPVRSAAPPVQEEVRQAAQMGLGPSRRTMRRRR